MVFLSDFLIGLMGSGKNFVDSNEFRPIRQPTHSAAR
jgi:hypothetical protein